MYSILLNIILLGNFNEIFFKKEKLGKVIIFISFSFMVMLSYFRSENIGADTINYMNTYKNISISLDLLNNYSKEKGFLFLMILFKSLGLSVHAFLGFMSFLSLGLLYISMKKLTDYPLLSILIFYSRYYRLWILSGVRQGFVYCACIYSTTLWLEGKRIKVILLLLASSLIHISALYFFIFLLLVSMKSNKIMVIFFIFLSYLLVNIGCMKFLLEKMEELFSASWRMQYYLSNDIRVNQLKLLKRLIKDIFPLLLLFYYSPVLKYKNKRLCSNLFLLGNIFYILSSDISTFSSRLGYFGFIFSSFTLTYFIDFRLKIYKKPIKKEIIYLSIMLLTIVRFFQETLILPKYNIFI